MDVDALFAAFRRDREPARLGEVFDACADDLFAVALHLCGDRSAAEDLVQATFLVAIERAHRWHADRPLRPWLLGILHREARQARRRARRRVDEARVPVRAEPPPQQRVLAAEVHGAVVGALGAVPQPYRSVLELHLVESMAPAAIAARLRRSPGAVRTQLWRGLELLRGLLPPGLGVAVGSELIAQTPLAAVRARVVDAAAAAAKAGAAGTGVGVLGVLGGMLMKKVLAAAVVGLGGVAAWSWWPAAPDSLEPAADAGAAAVPAAAAAAGDASSRSAAREHEARVAAAAPAAPGAAPPADAAPAPAPEPVGLPVLVVDANGSPVADATVSVFDVAMREGNGKVTATRERASSQPRTAVRTDADGRARVTIAGACIVCAEHERLGWSGDVPVRPLEQVLPQQQRLVLMPTATVRGHVRHANGAPLAGARVRATQPHASWYGVSDVFAATTTDEQGAFTCRVVARTELRLTAGLGRSTDLHVLAMRPGEIRDVELRLPGAFSIRGTVTDAAGRPLRARVRACGEDATAARTPPAQAACDEQGRFELLLTRGGAVHVLAGVEGQTAAHGRLVLDDDRPHAEVALRTQPFVSIHARVVDEHGRPVAGHMASADVDVPGDPELAQGTGVVWLPRIRRDLHGAIPGAVSDADGEVHLTVPANARCTLRVQAIAGNHELVVRSPAFAAPATDVVVVVRESDKQGLVLRGRAVAASDGAPLPDVRIELETFQPDGGGRSSGQVDRTRADGGFRIGPLLAGRRYQLAFEAEGFAKTIVGPFDATAREEELTVRLPRGGSVQCLVLRADGTPAAGAFASLQAPVHDPFGRAWQGDTDAAGRIEFRDVVPGPYEVHARATRAAESSTIVETVVHAEQGSVVQIVLAK